MSHLTHASKLINHFKSINLWDSVTQLLKNPLVLVLLTGKILLLVIAFTAGAQAVCH